MQIPFVSENKTVMLRDCGTYIEGDGKEGIQCAAAVMVKERLLYDLSFYDWSFYRHFGGERGT